MRTLDLVSLHDIKQYVFNSVYIQVKLKMIVRMFMCEGKL
jgi:hypothetical protein